MKYVLITLLLLIGLAGSAQQTTETNYRNWVRTNNAEKSKIALVIGNSKYQYTTQLAEPSNDANELANALNAQGYEVLKAFNLDRRTLVAAISDFAENFGEYEEGVIYYAGHGFQVNGINYLVPTDANPSSAWQVEGECINVRYLLDAINQPDIPKLILVDACRNNPFAKSWSGEGRNAEVGMRAVQALSNSIVIFSTAEQTVVRDNNPFAETFARHIQQGGCVEGDIIGRVAVDISRSNPNQLIRPTGFLFNNICFGVYDDNKNSLPNLRMNSMGTSSGTNKEELVSTTKTNQESEVKEASTFKASLGVFPDYIYNGNGLRIDEVIKNRPGAIGGLRDGDIIIKLGDNPISDIYDYIDALGYYKYGDSTDILVKREGDQVVVTVTF